MPHWVYPNGMLRIDSDKVSDVAEVIVYKPDDTNAHEQVRIIWDDGNETVFLYNPNYDGRVSDTAQKRATLS